MNEVEKSINPKKTNNAVKIIACVALAALLLLLVVKVLLMSYTIDVMNKGDADTNRQINRLNMRVLNLKECINNKDYTCQEDEYIDSKEALK